TPRARRLRPRRNRPGGRRPGQSPCQRRIESHLGFRQSPPDAVSAQLFADWTRYSSPPPVARRPLEWVFIRDAITRMTDRRGKKFQTAHRVVRDGTPSDNREVGGARWSEGSCQTRNWCEGSATATRPRLRPS